MYLPEYVDLSIKGVVAFIIPLGWAVIFYPLMRKLRKAWPVLVIIATIFSFSVFVLKEIMDTITPIFDEIITYALGIFLGGAALSLLFNFKSRWLDTPPKADLSFRNYKIGKGIHMRYLFQVAILIEEQGKEFYNKLVEKAWDANLKNLYSKLANDEQEHKQLFQNMLFRWLPLPTDKETLVSLIQELKSKGLFSPPPTPDATVEDMIRYAIEQEKITADFYLSFEKAFPETWKQMHIHGLVMTERAHANKLITLLPAH